MTNSLLTRIATPPTTTSASAGSTGARSASATATAAQNSAATQPGGFAGLLWQATATQPAAIPSAVAPSAAEPESAVPLPNLASADDAPAAVAPATPKGGPKGSGLDKAVPTGRMRPAADTGVAAAVLNSPPTPLASPPAPLAVPSAAGTMPQSAAANSAQGGKAALHAADIAAPGPLANGQAAADNLAAEDGLHPEFAGLPVAGGRVASATQLTSGDAPALPTAAGLAGLAAAPTSQAGSERPALASGAAGASSAATGAAPSQQLAPALVQLSHAPDGGRLTLRLNPVELGQVDIQIDRAADGSAAVHVTAERPETLQLLISDQAQLHHALDSAGLPQEGRTLSLGLGQSNTGDSGSFGAGGGQSGGEAAARDQSGGQQGRSLGWRSSGDGDTWAPGTDPATTRHLNTTTLRLQAGVDITA